MITYDLFKSWIQGYSNPYPAFTDPDSVEKQKEKLLKQIVQENFEFIKMNIRFDKNREITPENITQIDILDALLDDIRDDIRNCGNSPMACLLSHIRVLTCLKEETLDAREDDLQEWVDYMNEEIAEN